LPAAVDVIAHVDTGTGPRPVQAVVHSGTRAFGVARPSRGRRYRELNRTFRNKVQLDTLSSQTMPSLRSLMTLRAASRSHGTRRRTDARARGKRRGARHTGHAAGDIIREESAPRHSSRHPARSTHSQNPSDVQHRDARPPRSSTQGRSPQQQQTPQPGRPNTPPPKDEAHHPRSTLGPPPHARTRQPARATKPRPAPSAARHK
jgi:hypothetical protein